MTQIPKPVLLFQEELKNELDSFLSFQKLRFPDNETLKIDMHCHDHNSDVPDELLGRILNIPETWLTTEKLLETLKRNNVDVVTITNHNNARSCYELKEKGIDVLVGSEFSCMVPDFNIGIHVLTYGFTREQEKVLNKLRKNIYQFQQYALENDIPTIWAHPLYHYNSNGTPPMDFFNKTALIFERFEVLNGQRDTWQNMLVNSWIKDLTPGLIDQYAAQFNIDPKLYCRNPYKKSLSGGSDSHMGIFSGQTGTYLHVPNLAKRLKTELPSELALQAIKEGKMSPFGSHQNSEKLTITFLDYFCQIALNKEDPGLMRILLHKGTTRDKLLAFLITNAFSELQRHKITMRFIELFHNCFTGKVPANMQRLMVPRVYKSIFDDAQKIAKTKDIEPEEMIKTIHSLISSISDKLNTVLFSRLSEKVAKIGDQENFKNIDLNQLIEKFEIPSELRSYFDNKARNTIRKNGKRMSIPNIGELFDGLSFPFLASAIILGANFTSARVLYNTRPLLQTFSDKIGKLQHPQRMLWLTDTFNDNNGVAMVLQNIHKEIKKHNLPVDFLVCSNRIASDDHLIVIKPMAEFSLPFYEQQPLRIPNFNEIHNLFHEKEYDRIICSTEGIMGLVALYLKNAYSVKTHFYIHTDWMMFARKVLTVEKHNLNRMRRLLRAFYSGFDSLFVLNTDQLKWLTGRKMGFDSSRVHLTAHWADKEFQSLLPSKKTMFGLMDQEPVLLFSGRLSREKGVMEIPDIYHKLKTEIPNLRVVFAGTGPVEDELKKNFPEAIYLGWVNHDKLPQIYSSADLLILPSKFDTFSCVVLESLSCGLPVVAYKTKGPKDIIIHGENGYLAINQTDMESLIVKYFLNKTSLKQSFRSAAIERAKTYNANAILNRFLNDVELQVNI